MNSLFAVNIRRTDFELMGLKMSILYVSVFALFQINSCYFQTIYAFRLNILALADASSVYLYAFDEM